MTLNNNFYNLELESWIQKSQKNFIERDVEKNWKIHNPSNLEKLSWDEYRTGNFYAYTGLTI